MFILFINIPGEYFILYCLKFIVVAVVVVIVFVAVLTVFIAYAAALTNLRIFQ